MASLLIHITGTPSKKERKKKVEHTGSTRKNPHTNSFLDYAQHAFSDPLVGVVNVGCSMKVRLVRERKDGGTIR